ncbi:MAG: hypothetical protein WCL23_02655 [Candidatus Moraniibacteriota bacterium]
MPQDISLPGIESVPQAEQVPSQEYRGTPLAPESAPEQSRERAGERYSEILSKVTPQQPVQTVTDDDHGVGLDAQSVYSETDVEARVTKLLSLVETKGPEYAVRVAIKLNDFYVLDRMHDEMAVRFYDALVAKGVIKG